MKKLVTTVFLIVSLCLCLSSCEKSQEDDFFQFTKIEDVKTLEDGQTVTVWEDIFGRLYYKLENDQTLVQFDNQKVDKGPLFLQSQKLSQQAKEKIQLFFSQQKLPFNMDLAIEEAYERYIIFNGDMQKDKTQLFEDTYIAYEVPLTMETNKITFTV